MEKITRITPAMTGIEPFKQIFVYLKIYDLTEITEKKNESKDVRTIEIGYVVRLMTADVTEKLEWRPRQEAVQDR